MFCAGDAALQKFDLAVVVGFMFGHVEPFGVVVHAHLGVEGGKPIVVTLFEFSEILFARFVQGVEVVVETIAFDGFARGFVEAHRNIPFLFYVIGPTFPFHAAEGIEAVISFGCGQMEE